MKVLNTSGYASGLPSKADMFATNDGTVHELPGWLSCFPEKLRCFAADDAFRAGWQTLVAMDRDGTFPLERLWNLGSVMFKSDSLVAANTKIGMNLIDRFGFNVRMGREIRFDSSLVLAFWKYALGRLSDERIAVLTRLLTYASSLYLLVEAQSPDERLPTALILTNFKGEAVPELRQPGTLRSALGEPQTAMLNYVHTADEPADVIRELGLLFDEDGRRRCLLDVLRGCSVEAKHLCDHLLQQTRRADLSFSAALERVRRQLRECALCPHSFRANLERRLKFAEEGDSDSWRFVAASLRELGVPLDPLDDIIIDAQNVRLKKSSPTQPFPSCELRHWSGHHVVSPMDRADLSRKVLDGAG